MPATFSVEKLQQALCISRLPEYCQSIYEVMHDDGDHGEVNCLWGVFVVHRELIKGGIRFTLPGCPNNLAWTVTTACSPKPELTDIHCTIRQPEPDADPDFRESIDEFMDDWEAGLV